MRGLPKFSAYFFFSPLNFIMWEWELLNVFPNINLLIKERKSLLINLIYFIFKKIYKKNNN